jgi:hypothetical protein
VLTIIITLKGMLPSGKGIVIVQGSVIRIEGEGGKEAEGEWIEPREESDSMTVIKAGGMSTPRLESVG